MSDVRWIKIVTDIFDNRKIRQIEKMPEGDAIIVIWLKLLCLAGKVNDEGFICLTEEVPYTEDMLATEFNKPIQVVKLALVTFQKFGMIEVIDSVYKVSSWEKYQNIDGLEKIREQTRLRVAKHKAKKKALSLTDEVGNVTANVTANVTVTHGNAIDKEEDIDIEKDTDSETEKEREKEIDFVEKKNKQKKSDPVSEFEPLLSEYLWTEEMKDTVRDWIRYKTERNEYYKPTSRKTILKQIDKAITNHGETAVEEAILNAMANNYQGMGLDRISTNGSGRKTAQNSQDEYLGKLRDL